jgi:hypothetical protein
VSAIDEEVRRLVDERLRELGITPDAGTAYDRDHLPHGFTSPEAWAAECRRLGLDRAVFRAGRSWIVPRDVWERARAEARTRTRADSARTTTSDDIDSALRNSGLRLCK